MDRFKLYKCQFYCLHHLQRNTDRCASLINSKHFDFRLIAQMNNKHKKHKVLNLKKKNLKISAVNHIKDIRFAHPSCPGGHIKPHASCMFHKPSDNTPSLFLSNFHTFFFFFCKKTHGVAIVISAERHHNRTIKSCLPI